MKKFLLSVCFLLSAMIGFAQTNPTPQTLPVSINFGTANYTPPFGSMSAWTGGGTKPYANQATAEAGTAGADLAAGALFATAPTTSPQGGEYGHAVGANARLSIATSGNATNGSPQAVLAINTTGQTNITISYDLVLTVANARDIGIALQYRVGTTDPFTTITGTATAYNSSTTNGGDADGPTDFDNYSVALPAAAEGAAIVQLRWITWRGAQAGNNSAIGIDNIAIGGPAAPCTEPADQPSTLTFPTITPSSISGSFTAAVADGYLVIRNTTGILPAAPSDATSYTAGSPYGSSLVVSSGSSTTFTDNGLSANTTYYYFIYSYNNSSCSGGPNYYTAVAPLQGSITTSTVVGCVTPAAPAALSLTPANNAVSGNFTGSGASSYMVIVSTASTLGVSLSNSTNYPVGTAIPGANGGAYSASISSNTFFNIGGLSAATQYYFYVFSMNSGCSGEPFYSSASLNGTATTTNTGSGIPAGYYDGLAGLTCGSLKNALSNLTSSGQVTLSYGNLDDTQMPVADVIQSDDGLRSIIWDIYTNNPAGPEPFEYNASQNPAGGFCGGSGLSNCWNKEHTFPKSWFGSQLPTYADLFVVRPTDINVNSKRANIPYSVVGGATTYTFPASIGTYPGVPILDKIGPSTAAGVTASSAFEPADGVKGDIARGYFYILTRYQNNLNAWATSNAGSGIEVVVDGSTGGGTYPSFKLPYLTMLYNWHMADPVDARETNFNNLVYTQQNNRNPYVDHPEYVALVFQCTGAVPVTLIDFTAQKIKSSVVLQWYATQESSFSRFDVERSVDGITFNKIGEVPGQNLANYSFTDNDLPKTSAVYYRLRMVDADGKSRLSKIAAVKIENGIEGTVYPNPASGTLNIRLSEALKANANMIITDFAGRAVSHQSANANESILKVDVSRLPAGRYFMRIISNKQVINQTFTVAR